MKISPEQVQRVLQLLQDLEGQVAAEVARAVEKLRMDMQAEINEAISRGIAANKPEPPPVVELPQPASLPEVLLGRSSDKFVTPDGLRYALERYRARLNTTE